MFFEDVSTCSFFSRKRHFQILLAHYITIDKTIYLNGCSFVIKQI